LIVIAKEIKKYGFLLGNWLTRCHFSNQFCTIALQKPFLTADFLHSTSRIQGLTFIIGMLQLLISITDKLDLTFGFCYRKCSGEIII
jgi:hypothetical protein